MKISGKNRVREDKDNVNNYSLKYSNFDDVFVDAVESKESNETYVDPGYDEYSGIDTSMLASLNDEYNVYDMSNNIETVVDTGNLGQETVTSIPEALQNEADIFNDMQGLMDMTLNNVNNAMHEIPQQDMNDDSFLNDMNALGELVKNKCKGK